MYPVRFDVVAYPCKEGPKSKNAIMFGVWANTPKQASLIVQEGFEAKPEIWAGWSSEIKRPVLTSV